MFASSRKSRTHVLLEKPVFGIHGGGNIGLGLMAEVVSDSTVNYEIIATSNDPLLSRLMHTTSHYSLQHDEEKEVSHTPVKRVKLISRNLPDIIDLYKKASIMALCLTPVAFSDVAQDIATAMIKRYEVNKNRLDILVLMNIPACDSFVRERVKTELITQCENTDAANLMLDSMRFVPTVVDRIVTKIDENNIKLSLKRQLLKHSVTFQALDLDFVLSDAGKLCEIVQKYQLTIPLFNAEKHYALYVPASFSAAEQFPRLTRTPDLEELEAVKNKYINGPHAIMAWIGALLGCKTIAEAMRLPPIRKYIKMLMEIEIRPALMAEFPNLRHDDLVTMRKLFVTRCMNSTNDPVTRVGRDPLRKMNAHGRIRGTIEIFQKWGMDVSVNCLELGLAAGILYAIKGMDDSNPGCQKIKEIFNKSNGDYRAVICYKGESPAGRFQGLDKHKDVKLIDRIITQIKRLETLYHHAQAGRVINTDLVSAAERFSFPAGLPSVYMLSTMKLMSHLRLSQHQGTRASVNENHYTEAELKDNTHEFKRDLNTSSIVFFKKNENDMNLLSQLENIGLSLEVPSGHLTYKKNFKPVAVNCDLVFIRHGETYGNCGQATQTGKIDSTLVRQNKKNQAQRVFQGDVDTEINQLTLEGRKQARELVEKLDKTLLSKGWVPDIIYHSPLSRAKETGQPFVDHYGFEEKYSELDELREMSFGAWDNRRVCDLGVNDPCHTFYSNQNALVKQSGMNADGLFQVSESFAEVIIRVNRMLNQFNEKHPRQRILLFSHSMVGAALCILLGKGQQHENGKYLAFDGKRTDGTAYTMPNAVPFILSNDLSVKANQKIKMKQ